MGTMTRELLDLVGRPDSLEVKPMLVLKDLARKWWIIVLQGVTAVLFGAAIQLRRVIQGKFWMILGGIISIVFGAWVVLAPAAGALGVIWLTGLYASVFGAVLILAGSGLKKLSIQS